MHQSAAVSIANREGRNGGLSLVESVINSPANQEMKDLERTWTANIEPLSLLIHTIVRSFVGSLIDRRWRCTVELPAESDLESAKRAALQYAEQYMHLHLGEDSWALPTAVTWDEFVAIRSSEELQQRIACQCPTTIAPQMIGPALRKQSGQKSITPGTRPYSLSYPNPSRLALFLSLSEAACHTGLSEAFLRRKIHSGELPAIKDRGWKLRRADLRKI